MPRKKELIAYKHNRIVDFRDCEVKKIDPLTKNQMKIIALIATKVNSGDEDHKTYTMSFAEFSKLTRVNETNYEAVYETARKLTKLGIDIKHKNGDIIIFNWLQDVKISAHKGIIEYHISPTLLPHLKHSMHNKNFTKIHLLDYMPLSSKHATALYEFLAKWQEAGKVKITVPELRAFLRVETKYARNNNFIARCISEPIADINENAKNAFTVRVEYHYQDARKNVKAITFHITKIKKNEEKKATTPTQKTPKTTKPKVKKTAAKKATAKKNKAFKKAYETIQNIPVHPD